MDLDNIVRLLVTALCTVRAATGPRSVNLVDILKQDLRTNNDDYIDSTTASHLCTTEGAPTVATEENKQTVKDKYNSPTKAAKFYDKNSSFNKENTKMRRSLNEINDAIQSNFEKNQYLQPINRKTTVTNVTVNTNEINNTMTPVTITQTTSNKVRKEHALVRSDAKQSQKMQNLMKFVVKNKEKFNNFLNKKIEQSVVETQTKSMATNPKLKSYPSMKASQLRLRASSGEQPQNDRLDMAPARGGKIHVLRVKNRLCHRHVMLPEGPKYDRRGRTYLGAFTHDAGRDFRLTRRPRLLLPRCCNCCKKSVLGCE